MIEAVSAVNLEAPGTCEIVIRDGSGRLSIHLISSRIGIGIGIEIEIEKDLFLDTLFYERNSEGTIAPNPTTAQNPKP